MIASLDIRKELNWILEKRGRGTVGAKRIRNKRDGQYEGRREDEQTLEESVT